MVQSNPRQARGAVVLAGFAFCLLQAFSTTSVFGVAAVESPGASDAGSNFITKVVGAAAQGAVAACVAALLSAFTEPIVNRLLVERCTVAQAINSVKIKDCLNFFLTTFPTNMLKFPVFEVINMSLSFTSMSGSVRGIVSGFLFCTFMLPVTNYRFRKSMNLPIEPALLYQAYPPTVIRDILYGWARGLVQSVVNRQFVTEDTSYFMKAFYFGIIIWGACVISSPCNEWRGYWLQQPNKKLPFNEFFKPERYVRSTGVGSTIMGISLMVGMLLVPYAEFLFEWLKTNKPAAAVAVLLVVAGFVQLSRSK
jgi:hypothetical protein